MTALIHLYARVGIPGGLLVALALAVLVATVLVLIRGRQHGIALPAVAGTMAAGLVMGLMLFVDRAQLQRAHGELESAHFVGDGAGTMVITIDKVPKIGLGHKKGWTYRVSSYSAVRGARTARTIVIERVTWLGEAGGRAWFESSELGLHARDPVTLDLIALEKNLADKNPILVGGVTRAEIDRDARGLIIDTKPGARVYLDATTLTARPATETDIPAAAAPPPPAPLFAERTVGATRVTVTADRLEAIDPKTAQPVYSTPL